jgi:hypothetical protein
MSHTVHRIVKCSTCGTIIGQCRCAAPDKPIHWVPDCESCRGKVEEPAVPALDVEPEFDFTGLNVLDEDARRDAISRLSAHFIMPMFNVKGMTNGLAADAVGMAFITLAVHTVMGRHAQPVANRLAMCDMLRKRLDEAQRAVLVMGQELKMKGLDAVSEYHAEAADNAAAGPSHIILPGQEF